MPVGSVPKIKKVLWITSFFPPYTNVATARSLKFLKYLPSFGWEAVVVCPKDKSRFSTAAKEQIDQLNNCVRIARTVPDLFHNFAVQHASNPIARCVGHVMNNVIPPDGHIYWTIASLYHIGKTIRIHKPDLVFTTCNPYSLNLAGLLAKKRFGIPWVTDFRDLWTLNQQPRRILKRYHGVVSGILEKYYLRRCNHLVVTTVNSAKRMTDQYGFLKNRTTVIPNGFDMDDLMLQESTSKIPFSFFYSGSIVAHTSYNPMPVLTLLARLENEGRLHKDWAIHYSGSQGNDFAEMAKRAGVLRKVKNHGYLGHKDYYKLIGQMQYVIMCLPSGLDCKSWIPSRTYDYMGNRTNIICMAHKNSEVFRIFEEYDNGLALYYEDSQNEQVAKLKTYLEAAKSVPQPSDEFLERFNRKVLTGRLAMLFDGLIQFKKTKYNN